MNKRVFDCFTFFNELDMLELRLNELYDKVEFFVLAEAPVTFQGKPKPLFYGENKHRFADFADKIIHLVIMDMPASQNAWDREHFQRNALRRGLAKAAADDIVIISDADEIVSRDAIDILRVTSGFTQLNMPMYQYYMNLREQHGWSKVFAFTCGLLPEIPDFNWVRTSQAEAYEKFAGRNRKMFNAGWHFTYLGGAESIRQKLQAFSHTEAWFQHMASPGGIEAQLAAGYEVGNSWNFARYCEIDSSYPTHVQNNVKKYTDLGFIKNPYEALREMQGMIRFLHDTIRRDRKRLRELEAGADNFSRFTVPVRVPKG
jgi:hypothetical protein